MEVAGRNLPATSLQPLVLLKLLCFCRTEIVTRRYHSYNHDTSLASGLYLLKKAVIWQHQLQLSIFLCYCHYFTGALEAVHLLRTLCLPHNTCCNHPLQQAVCDSIWSASKEWLKLQLLFHVFKTMTHYELL